MDIVPSELLPRGEQDTGNTDPRAPIHRSKPCLYPAGKPRGNVPRPPLPKFTRLRLHPKEFAGRRRITVAYQSTVRRSRHRISRRNDDDVHRRLWRATSLCPARVSLVSMVVLRPERFDSGPRVVVQLREAPRRRAAGPVGPRRPRPLYVARIARGAIVPADRARVDDAVKVLGAVADGRVSAPAD